MSGDIKTQVGDNMSSWRSVQYTDGYHEYMYGKQILLGVPKKFNHLINNRTKHLNKI